MVPHSTAIAYGVPSKQQLHPLKHQLAQRVMERNPQFCAHGRARAGYEEEGVLLCECDSETTPACPPHGYECSPTRRIPWLYMAEYP